MSEKPEQQPESDQEPVPVGEISQQPSAFENFLDANQKKLIIGGIIIIVALVAYVVVDGLAKNTLENNSAAVSAARTVPELETQASEKAGTNAGGTALIHKARLQWEDLQQAEAVKTLESFLSDYPEHPAYASGLASLASYHQNMGEVEKAKEYYSKAVEENAAVSSIALISLGDIARNEGDDEAAKAFYDKASSEYGELHANIKGLAERHAKLLGVEAPTKVQPTPPAPKTPTPGAPNPGVPSNPVKVDPLPKAPDTGAPKPPTPVVPKTPTPGGTPKPDPVKPAPDKPVEPAPKTQEGEKPEKPKAPSDPFSN